MYYTIYPSPGSAVTVFAAYQGDDFIMASRIFLPIIYFLLRMIENLLNGWFDLSTCLEVSLSYTFQIRVYAMSFLVCEHTHTHIYS